jgi:hypothetical protein
MLKKPLNYSNAPGPLMVKHVFNNEKVLYYAKRYCPIKEKKPQSQMMNFHPSTSFVMSEGGQNDSLDEDCVDSSFVFKKDAILGLKLDPPEFRKPPRNKANFNSAAAASIEGNSRNFIKHTSTIQSNKQNAQIIVVPSG